jgi:CheY-like chemotaxis protein
VKIVASNNSFVYDELSSNDFLLVQVELIIVGTGDEALAAAREHQPDLVLLDADMPGTDGYAVCSQIKNDPELSSCHVIVALQGTISAPQLKRLAECGCDDAVVYRVPGETLYHHAARLLGLPDRTLGTPVTLRVVIADGTTNELVAQAARLSTTQIDLLVPATLHVGQHISLTLCREHSSEAVTLSGRVVSEGQDHLSCSPSVTIAFDEVTPRLRARLADLALWDARMQESGLLLHMRGPFDEDTDFSGIAVSSARNVVFDLSGVGLINSWGARKWIMFLRSLSDELSYVFVNAPAEFIKHCNMVADMTGEGRVLSFKAPYECDSCGKENERILQVSSISPSVMHEPPEFRCRFCAGPERFAEDPARYFAFLRS